MTHAGAGCTPCREVTCRDDEEGSRDLRSRDRQRKRQSTKSGQTKDGNDAGRLCITVLLHNGSYTVCLVMSSSSRPPPHMIKASAQCLNTPSPILWNSKFWISRATIAPWELRTSGMYTRSFLSCGNAFKTATIFLWAGVILCDVPFAFSCDGIGVFESSTISTTMSSTSRSSSPNI